MTDDLQSLPTAQSRSEFAIAIRWRHFPESNVTAQIPDTVRYSEKDWHLAGINGTGLFEPQDHGLQPKGMCSACWRGFYCKYTLVDSMFRLDTVTVVAHEGPLPDLFGRSPAKSISPICGCVASYASIAAPMPFTGGMLFARGFKKELYVHMGFHPAWKYSDVIEVEFESGRMASLSDRSEAMAQLRAHLKPLPNGYGTARSNKEISAWVERAFSRKY